MIVIAILLDYVLVYLAIMSLSRASSLATRFNMLS